MLRDIKTISKFIFRFTNKLLFVVAVYMVVMGLFFVFISQDNAKNQPRNQVDVLTVQRNKLYVALNNSADQKTELGRLKISLWRSTLCSFLGEGCSANAQDPSNNFDGSIFGKLTQLMTMTYSNPPASGLTWVYSGLQNVGFIPKSYAAEGIGFASIKGFIPIWNLMRQISYLIIVLVIITIGFMIMFRTKINPQTVISIENALPRIVMALIYITFSFAIAGFVIDLMYVVMSLMIASFTQLNIGSLTPAHMLTWQGNYLAGDMSQLFPPGKDAAQGLINPSGTMLGLGYVFWDMVPLAIRVIIQGIAGIIVTGPLVGIMLKTAGVTGIVGSFADIAAGSFSIGKLPDILTVILRLLLTISLASFIPGLILGLVILLTVLYLVFRLFMLLLTSYLKIILLIVFSPIVLMLEAIPGRNAFADWIKSLVGELIAFPLVVVFMLTGYAIINLSAQTGTYFTLPFIGGIPSDAMSNIIGVGIIFIIPDLIKLIRKSIGLKDLPINMGVGTFFGGAALLGTAQGVMSGVPSLFNTLPYGVQQKLRDSKTVGKFINGWIAPSIAEQYKAAAQGAQEATSGSAKAPATPGSGGGSSEH